MKCSKCGKEIINIQKASCISGYDEKGKHENWLCEKCSSEWDKEHPCYPIDYVKKSITDFVCKKCGSTEYEIKDKSNGTGIAHGLYCAKCGFWHKWLSKKELKQYSKNHKNIKLRMKDNTERYIDSLFIDFDEMGFAPTTPCPDAEKYAIEWREKVRAEFERLEIENAALRERLKKSIALPLEPVDYHWEPMAARIVERADSNKVDLRIPCYIYFEFDSEEEAEKELAELSNEHI